MNTTQRTGAPTSKQLRYLRILAERTGTTFTPPQSCRQASNEIARLRSLLHARGRYEQLAEPAEGAPAYATAPVAEEIEGQGSSARWRTSAPPVRPRTATVKPPAKVLATYELSGERREIVGERDHGRPRLVDRRVLLGADRYLIETDIAADGQRALDALLADYLDQAAALKCVPMTTSLLAQELDAGKR